jgi:hypothetical protein
MRRFGLFFAILLTLTALTSPAASAAPPQVAGATVISNSSVKIVFAAAVDAATAGDVSHYVITPSFGAGAALTVRSATVTDSARSVVLATSQQLPGVPYTVRVSGVLGDDGQPMAAPGESGFLGIDLGPNSPSSMHDDFNRPSGLAEADLPIPGPWLSADISTANSLSLDSSPTFEGAGSLHSHVADINPARDNALVRYKIKSGNEYYLSAYVYIPTQTWSADQVVSVLRLDEFEFTTQARLAATFDDASHFSLSVDWRRSQLDVALGNPRTVATGLEFDRWYWLQLHVRNSTSTTTGAVTVWVDGVDRLDLSPVTVANVKMIYAEFGVGHVVTDGPAATVYTDEARLGTDKQPPALETSPPTTTASVAHMWWNGPVRASAQEKDAGVGVKDTHWTLDGADIGTGPTLTLPITGVAEGRHTLGYWSADYLGNAETPHALRIGVDTRRPTTTARKLVTVKRLKTATFRFTVRDALPSSGRATVVIRIRNAKGKVVKVLHAGSRTVNRLQTLAFTCRLKRGTYRYSVGATDLAGNVQSKAGSGKLRVF